MTLVLCVYHCVVGRKLFPMGCLLECIGPRPSEFATFPRIHFVLDWKQRNS